MEMHTGTAPDPIADEFLLQLQAAILGPITSRIGIRKSPIFVGRDEAVDYFAPHWNQVGGLLLGLSETLRRTNGSSPIMRTALASFGFAYIHPLSDGNGRVSRFLVNDILRRDGAVPAPFILPVSATSTESSRLRVGYDEVLERFSRPLLRRYREAYRFGREVTNEDGVISNFEFDPYDDALFAWRYPDYSDHVAYLHDVIYRALTEEMRAEASYLRMHDLARERLQEIMEAPTSELDRIIRSVKQNGYKVSGKLRNEIPLLDRIPGLDTQVAKAVKYSFEPAAEELDRNDDSAAPPSM